MAGKAKAVTTAVRLGVKYGPAAYAAIKHGKEPAKEFAQKQLSKLAARRQALAHADGLMDGSTMAVWDGDHEVWVVFNGDEAVGSHPTTATPLAQLIRDYDLAKRIRPTNDQRPKPNPLKAIRRKG